MTGGESRAPQRGWRRGDLRGRPFPAPPEGGLDGPGGQREALRLLREWAEQEAEDAIDWYLRDKKLKRLGSRVIRGLTIMLAVAGTAVPLGVAATGGSAPGWGYVLLAVAAGCRGFDYFFGLSSSWMRDIAAAQALRAELTEVRLEWSAHVLRTGPRTAGPDDGRMDPEQLDYQLALVTRLVTAVRAHIESETAEWLAEFSSSSQQLQEQQGPGAAAAGQA